MEFCKTAAYSKTVHYKHSDKCFDVELAAHRNTLGVKYRVTYDKGGGNLSLNALGRTLIVVSKAGKIVFFNESVKSAGGFGSLIFVLVGQLGLRVALKNNWALNFAVQIGPEDYFEEGEAIFKLGVEF